MEIIKTKKQETPRWRKNRTEEIQKDHGASRLFSRIIFYFLLLCFAGVSLYVLLFSPFMQLQKMSIMGNNEIDSAEIESATNAYLAGKYLGFLPKNNFLLVSTKLLEKNLLSSFKKVRLAKVAKKFPDTLEIQVEERKSLLVWCSGEECYLIDDQGFAYQEADFASREIQENHLLKIVQDDGKQVEIGTQVMSEEMVEYYTTLREAFLQKTKLKLGEELHVNSRLAEDGTVKTEQGFDLLLNFSIPAQRSAEIMKTFLGKQYKNGDLGNLSYVDLRVENKIFYRTK